MAKTRTNKLILLLFITIPSELVKPLIIKLVYKNYSQMIKVIKAIYEAVFL